jgi:hypothetical protein
MFKKLSFLCLSIFLIIVSLCADYGKQLKGKVKSQHGVKVVKNPYKSLFPENSMEFEEELLIPESDGKNYVFVKLSSLNLDENSNIYVLDSREAKVMVFNKQGNFLRSFGKKGAGPGELDVPGHLNIFRRDQITVKDGGNRRITFYSLEGEYKGSLSAAGFASGDMKIDTKGNIFCIVTAFVDGQRRNELQKFDSSLNYLKTFDYSDAPMEKELAFFLASPCFAVLKGDFIAYGNPDKDYEIKIYDNEGTLVKRILREDSPERIPEDEIEYATRGVSKNLEIYIPKYYPPYYNIFVDDEGRIITLRRNKMLEKVKYFDVFSAEGNYLTSTRLRGDFDGYRCVWKNEKLYTMGSDEDGLPVVRIYQIKWKDNFPRQ